MQTRTRILNIQMIFLSLFVVLFVFFLYAFFHEAGHAVIGFAFGQSLTEFNISFWDFSAHVEMIGGDLTQSQFAIQAIAGVSLPLLVWGLFISLISQKASFILEVLKLISSMVVLNTLLAWIVIPVLYLFGKAPPSDDVTHFLRYSEMPPLLLVLTAVIVYIGGWVLFLSKIDGLRKEILLFRAVDHKTLTAGIRQTGLLMVCVLASCIFLTYLMNSSAARNLLDRFSPPQDFVSVAKIDLSAQAYSAETLSEFSLDEPAYVGIFTAVQGINTTYFDLSVVGSNGYNSIVLHGEGYRADRDGGLWEENLPPGTYQVVLTSHQSPGTLSVSLKAP